MASWFQNDAVDDDEIEQDSSAPGKWGVDWSKVSAPTPYWLDSA